MPDLLALVLPLTPLGEAPPDAPYLGRAAHGWFMRTVARLDPALAARLHGRPGPRPFALWPALDGGRSFLRVTSIDPALTAFLLDRWLPSLPRPIVLERSAFACGAVAQRSLQHPWAGQTRYADLIQHTTGQSAGRDRSLSLTFATPTLFRSNNLDVPLPLPTLVFDGLLQKWNRFAPVPMDDDMKAWIETHLAVGRYRLATRLLTFSHDGRDVMPGFRGGCRLVFVRADPIHRAMVRALAEFAFYAGVGRRTTMGMGQARVGTKGAQMGRQAG